MGNSEAQITARLTTKNVSIAITTALFILICLLPILYMIAVSFLNEQGSFTMNNYRHLFMEPRQRSLLWNTFWLGSGTTCLATAIGVPLGFFLARFKLPGKELLRLALVIPLAIPTFVLALAWIYIGGSAGLATKLLGSDLLSMWTYSITGGVMVLGLNLYPITMLATEAAVRRIEGHLEEAALMVASSPQVFWRITLPIIAPNIAAAALITFILSISEFGVPSLLRVPVYTSEVFTAFAALYDFRAATALAVPLIIMALVVSIAIRFLIGDRFVATRRFSSSSQPKGGSASLLFLCFGVFVLLISVVLPLAVLLHEAKGIAPIVSSIGTSSGAIVNSLALSAIGAVLVVSLAAVLGYGAARAPKRLRALANIFFIATFAVPGTVVGIGLINIWNRPGLFGNIYKSVVIIVIAYVARFLPIAALILAANVQQVTEAVEEAARVAGATWWKTFVRILIPQLRTGLGAALVVAFIFSFGEISATVLVTPPGTSTLPIHIYTMIANAPSSTVAALALLQTAIILTPLIIFGVAGGYGRSDDRENRRQRVR